MFESDHDIYMELAHFHDFNVEYRMGSDLKVMDQRKQLVDIEDGLAEEEGHAALVALWNVVSNAVKPTMSAGFPNGFASRMLRRLVLRDISHLEVCSWINAALKEFGGSSAIQFMGLKPNLWCAKRCYKSFEADIGEVVSWGECALNPNYVVIQS